MSPLPIEEVRRLAALHAYREVLHNEVSRIVAFVDSPGNARVNVYYTTGTVATCLDHPRSGKTQLFRRDRSLHDLAAIFADVRTHTGAGYYRRGNGSPSWAPSASGGGEGAELRPSAGFSRGAPECDDAKRWRYIHAATGFCNESQANQIAALCRLWDNLRFQPGGCTSKEYYEELVRDEENKRKMESLFGPRNFCSDSDDPCCRCSCSERAGAWCCLYGVVAKVARDTEQVHGIYTPETGEGVDEAINEAMTFQHINQACSCNCYEGNAFKTTYSTMLTKLERQLRSFPRPIRRELIVWLFQKMTRKKCHMIVFEDNNISVENSRFLEQFCCNTILACHHDYGETFYPEIMTKGCHCHGM